MNLRVACVLWGCVAVATAQTYIVDAANGPGTNFTSIVAAIPAVPDGAVLVVRAGNYGSFTIDGKGLTVLGEPGAQVTTLLGPTITNLTPAQGVLLRGLVLTPFFGSVGSANVTLQNCQGSVALEGLSASTGAHRLIVQQCAHVQVRNCIYNAQVSVTGSAVAFTDCWLSSGSTQAAILQQGGSVQLTNAQLHGVGFGVPAAGPCVAMVGGDLRVLGASLLDTTLFGGNPGPALIGNGVVRIDPSVTVAAGAVPFGPGLVVTTLAMPHVTAVSAPLGGTLFAGLRGPVGSLGVLSVAWPGPAVAIAPLADPIFWDLSTAVNQAVGVPAVGQPVGSQIVVPNNPVFRGVGLVYHGFTWEPVGGLQVSNPVAVVVH